ncbi:hypothetical protein JCM8547_005539 [Rhodosporidiobolus lusitaniae]
MAPDGTSYDIDQDFDTFPGFPQVQSKAIFPASRDAWPELTGKPPVNAPPSRGLKANPALPNLVHSSVERIDLTPSIGTELRGVQLSQLNDAGRDELALLLAQRGVVFFRDQDLTDNQQGALFNYFDHIEDVPVEEADKMIHDIKELEADYRQTYVYYPWKFADAHADGSYLINPPNLSLLKITDLPNGGGGDTVFTSQYGLYDSLSPVLQEFVSSLKAAFFEARTNYSGREPKERPIDTHHPLVITHPVTGWRALYFNSNFVHRIANVKYQESQALFQFLQQHVDAGQDHQVRFRWEKNSVAIWDNRACLHRATHDYYPNPRAGRRATSTGAIPTFDPKSLSRSQATGRTATGARQQQQQ